MEYILYSLDGTPLMAKSAQEFNAWKTRYDVRMPDGSAIDNRKLSLHAQVIRMNRHMSKLLRVSKCKN